MPVEREEAEIREVLSYRLKFCVPFNTRILKLNLQCDGTGRRGLWEVTGQRVELSKNGIGYPMKETPERALALSTR